MKFFFTLISVVPLFTFGQLIKISGKFLKSEPGFNKLYIGQDSVTLNSDNTFSYKGEIGSHNIIFLLANKKSPSNVIWVTGGSIDLILEEYVKPNQNKSIKFLKIDSIKGPKETEAYQYLRDSLNKLSERYPIRNILGVDSMKLGYFKIVKDYVEKHKETYFSSMLTDYPFTLDHKKELLALIKDNRSSQYLDALNASIKQMELLKPGTVIPDFKQPGADGKSVSLYSLKGRFILIQFWASWCIPCRWENPQLIKLYSKYHPQGDLEIIDISLDTEDGDWKQAITKDSLPWINVSDLSGWQNLIAQKYIVTPHVPFNILIDNSHSVVAFELWPSQVEQILERSLGK